MLKELSKSCLVAFAILAFAHPGWAQLKGDTFAEAKAKGVAHVTYAYIETPGISELKDGIGKGLCVDLMTGFAKWLKANEGIELKPTHYGKDQQNFAAFMKSVHDGQGGVFGMGDVTITEERKQMYSFSPAYINNFSMLVTHKDAPNLQSLDQISSTFAGMKAVTAPSTLNEKWVENLKAKHYAGLQIKYVNASEDMVKAVVNDPKSFANIDFTWYLMALQKAYPIKRHAVTAESTEIFGIVMPKNSDWAPVMARFLTEAYKTSPEYRKMLSDNLGPNALKLLDSMSRKN